MIAMFRFPSLAITSHYRWSADQGGKKSTPYGTKKYSFGKESAKQLVGMRTLERVFLIIGVLCLGLYGFFVLQQRYYQSQLEREFERELAELPSAPSPQSLNAPKLSTGDLVGRLSVPRLDLSVMVME